MFTGKARKNHGGHRKPKGFRLSLVLRRNGPSDDVLVIKDFPTIGAAEAAASELASEFPGYHIVGKRCTPLWR